MKSLRIGLLLVVAAAWALGLRGAGPLATQTVSAQGGRVFYISRVDSSKFPRVTFQLRVVDGQSNRVATGLTDKDVAIYENGVQQTGVTRERATTLHRALPHPA